MKIALGLIAPGNEARYTCQQILTDDSGQDLIEYALLCAFIAFAGLTALNAIELTMGAAYTSWSDPMGTVGPDELPEMPDPAPSL